MARLSRRELGLLGLAPLLPLVGASKAARADPSSAWKPPGVAPVPAFYDDFSRGLRLRNCPGRDDSRTGYTDDGGAPDVKVRWLDAVRTVEIGGYKQGVGTWTPREKWPNGAKGYPGNKVLFMIDPEYPGWKGQTPFAINEAGRLEIRLVRNDRRDVVPDRDYLGGLLSTRWAFAQRYGYFAARMKIPAGRGVFPALWLLPHNANPDGSTWPPEIDIVESTGEREEYFGSIHFKNASGPKQHIGKTFPVPGLFGSWHEFGALWTPQSVQYFCDGKPMGEIPTQFDTNRSPMYVLVNLSAHDGTWGPKPDDSVLPGVLEIDWVGAWPLQQRL